MSEGMSRKRAVRCYYRAYTAGCLDQTRGSTLQSSQVTDLDRFKYLSVHSDESLITSVVLTLPILKWQLHYFLLPKIKCYLKNNVLLLLLLLILDSNETIYSKDKKCFSSITLNYTKKALAFLTVLCSNYYSHFCSACFLPLLFKQM